MDKQAMFRKLPQEMLTEALENLQQENHNLKSELYMRSAPRIAEMQTALTAITQAATNGDQTAKRLLAQFFSCLDAARAAASSIVIPTERPVKFEEPTHPEGWSIDSEQKRSS